ncbi:MAG TPA: hypothetical protein VMF09_05760 [Solirubrobacteraceae bacterium]|nr:hypothetical protein [Solirubrobacteraceae bacterium]
MPDADPSPRAPAPGWPSDELVLAGVERAERHDARASRAVPVWTILEHLDVRRRSHVARHVAARLVALAQEGWLARSRRHGVLTWTLTPAGERRLADARRAERLPALGESPQHRAWRNARTAAAQEIERFSGDVRELLERAASLLERDPAPHSDAWLELGEALQRACRCVASASYCLREWAEPDDALADVDERIDPTDEQLAPDERARRRARRAGRRNIRLWDERAGA